MQNKINIPNELKKMDNIFQKNGFNAYLVGGAVRDIIRGKKAADWDIATDATPEQVISIFNKVIPTGIAHGTVTVIFMGQHIEVTTFRSEEGYSDGRHPDTVTFGTDLTVDLSRRDFTMNAIAISLRDGKIFDPFDGRTDISKGIIRTVRNPHQRFDEDGLRPIRAIRFASQLGFEIEEETFKAIPSAMNRIISISIERFRDEFVKIMSSDVPSIGLKLLEETGILSHFIPELISCRNVEQADCRGIHQFDVLDHLFYACDGAPKEKTLVRLAALFHDIGKPKAKKIEFHNDVKNITFYNHEIYSANMTKEIMSRLRFSNTEIDTVYHLVKNHMFHYESVWTDAAVRRFIMRVTVKMIPDLFDLRIADVYGMTRTAPVLKNGSWSENLLELKDRIDFILTQNSAFSVKDLAINGKDLIALGIPAGKNLGNILDELLETVLDDPECNTKEKLSEIAVNIAKQNGIL